MTVVSRVDILKRRFKRLDLVREYFSFKKSKKQRKFRFPINESAN